MLASVFANVHCLFYSRCMDNCIMCHCSMLCYAMQCYVRYETARCLISTIPCVGLRVSDFLDAWHVVCQLYVVKLLPSVVIAVFNTVPTYSIFVNIILLSKVVYIKTQFSFLSILSILSTMIQFVVRFLP